MYKDELELITETIVSKLTLNPEILFKDHKKPNLEGDFISRLPVKSGPYTL